VKMKQLDLKLIKMLSSSVSLSQAENYLRSSRANIVLAKDEKVMAEVDYEGTVYKVLIQKNEERNFDTSCTCRTETHHPLCVHKTIVLLQLLHNYGVNYFDSIKNFDKEKDKLLSLYGYSLQDNLEGKFEFTYKDGKPFLRVLDASIKRLAPQAQPVKSKFFEEPSTVEIAIAAPGQKQTHKLGIVFSSNPHQYPYLQTDAVEGESNEAGTHSREGWKEQTLQNF